MTKAELLLLVPLLVGVIAYIIILGRGDDRDGGGYL